jgi:hypothetical protein
MRQRPQSAPILHLPAGEPEGLEGFHVFDSHGSELGHVAAVERTEDGYVVFIAPRNARRHAGFRAIAWERVARISLTQRTVLVTDEGAKALALAPSHDSETVNAEDPAMVRFVPTTPGPVIDDDTFGAEPSSARVILAVAVGSVGMLGILAAGALAVASETTPAWIFLSIAISLWSIAVVASVRPRRIHEEPHVRPDASRTGTSARR